MSGISLPERTPVLVAQVRVGPRVEMAGPIGTWEFGPLVDELLMRLGTNGGAVGELELDAQFEGSPPALQLSPQVVQRLALGTLGIDLSIRWAGEKPDPLHRTGRDRTRVRARFVVSGLFDPDEFTREVQVAPTRITRREDLRRVMARVSTWQIETEAIEADAFPEEMTDRLVGLVLPKAPRIASEVSRRNLRSVMRYSASVAQTFPRLRLTPDQVRAIASIQSWVETSFLYARENSDWLEF